MHPKKGEFWIGNGVNQVLAQMELWSNRETDHYSVDVHMIPKKLDEEVAELMVQGFGGVLTRLTKSQADYIGVNQEGPYKTDDYKY